MLDPSSGLTWSANARVLYSDWLKRPARFLVHHCVICRPRSLWWSVTKDAYLTVYSMKIAFAPIPVSPECDVVFTIC
jgi:hypothetical protein